MVKFHFSTSFPNHTPFFFVALVPHSQNYIQMFVLFCKKNRIPKV